MLMLASGGLSLRHVARNFPDSAVWRFVGYQFDHCPWRGCSLWDLIQPLFMFMVGVAIPWSYASRKAKGDSDLRILLHTIRRSLLLILLGVFLSSTASEHTRWIFTNVLSQIGLGYTFVFLLRGRGGKTQFGALAAILVVSWSLFVHVTPFVAAATEGGYQTLNFVPSMATMLLGLMAGELLRGPGSAQAKLLRLVGAGAACFAVAIAADLGSVCPIVKRIWTPSWALFSAGWTFWILAAFYWFVDIKGRTKFVFPLVVVGMNSIAMYMMGQLMTGWIRQMVRIHGGRGWFDGVFGPLYVSVIVLVLLWAICFWMFRRKLFLKI